MTASASTAPLAVMAVTSSGIGLELARQFAGHGFDLVIAAEDAELEPAAEELRRSGVTVTPARWTSPSTTAWRNCGRSSRRTGGPSPPSPSTPASASAVTSTATRTCTRPSASSA